MRKNTRTQENTRALRIRCGITASILLFVPSPSHGLISLVPWDSTASVADLETVAVNSPRILIQSLLQSACIFLVAKRLARQFRKPPLRKARAAFVEDRRAHIT